MGLPAERWANYLSGEHEPARSAIEIDRRISMGYAKLYNSWQAVLEDFESVLVSKLAVIIKTKEDGTLKVRGVLDLRRSKYNSFVKGSERIVVPRLRDLVEEA